MKNLPKRLTAVKALIPKNVHRIADIGYDHGQLMAQLVQKRPDVFAIGVDKQRDAANRFWQQTLPESDFYRSRIDLRCGDGLQPLMPGEVDCAIFAGLGENVITTILKNNPAVVKKLRRMVFAPLKNLGELRPALAAFGWRICAERPAYENRRFYLVFAAEPGAEENPHPIMQYFAPRLYEEADPMLLPYLEDLRRKLGRAVQYTEEQPYPFRHICENIDTAIALVKNM